MSFILRSLILCSSLVGVLGCDRDFAVIDSWGCDGVNQTLTVNQLVANRHEVVCGSISVYGFLRLDTGEDGMPLYTLVSDPEFLSRTISIEDLSFMGVALDFSHSEFHPNVQARCVGKLVVASADIDGVRSNVVLKMGPSAALTEIGDGTRQMCRSQ